MRPAATLLSPLRGALSTCCVAVVQVILLSTAMMAWADAPSTSQARHSSQPCEPLRARIGSDSSEENTDSKDKDEKDAEGDVSQSFQNLLRPVSDWGGARPWLDMNGITLDVQYSADFLHNTYGGLTTGDAHAFRGLLNAGLTLDTQAMGLWDGGTFFINFQQIHGRDISEQYVGDLQRLNNADAPDRTQVAEYWYEQRWLDGKLRTKLGKMDANADFAFVDYGLEFMQSSAGFFPNVPLTTYPDPALGAVLFIEPVDWFYVGAGVYDADGLGDRWGFKTALHDRNHALTIVELGVRPVFALAGQRLPGTYRVGGWYHSGLWEVIVPDADTEEQESLPTHRGNAGLYLSFDQLLYQENPDSTDDEQGLGVFFQFAYAPPAYTEISQYYGTGLQYTGFIPTRNEDIVGIGMFHASLSGRIQSLEHRFSETAVELFYKWQLTPFLSIQPELHYIVNPGGDGRDALVAGARLEIAL